MKLKHIFENAQNTTSKSGIFLQLSKYFSNVRLSQIKINNNEISYTGHLIAVPDVQTLSSMPPVIITPMPGPSPYDLTLKDCQKLTSLDGIERVTLFDRTPLKVDIINCPALNWDPYELAILYNLKIRIRGPIPPNTRIVKTVVLDPAGHRVAFSMTELPNAVFRIISKYHHNPPVGMLPLASELIAAGYERHARLQ